MARVSRKPNKVSADQAAGVLKEYSVGIYTRLSVEDNGYESKDSIQNQIAFLRDFVARREELNLIQTYVDNGTTGTNFAREQWNCLIEDIKAGKINCIVVKDFSRIGRNYIEVGNYLEKIFPFLQIRVIAVNENYDSNKQNFESGMLMNSLTNIVNEYYAKDISRKVTQVKRTMQQKGEFVSGVLPYGYKKSAEDRKVLIIDGESASIVRKIFEWRLQGKGCTVISNYLNELALPSPGLYRYMNGNQSFKRSENTKWKSKHVAGILTNPVYLGHMVQGKTRQSYFELGGKLQLLPKEEWNIVKNTHEALVSQEEFDIVSAMAENSRKKHVEQMNVHKAVPHLENPLRKKIFCGQCGGLLTRRSRVLKGMRDYCYFCAAPQMQIGVSCRNTHIHEEPLMEAIVEAADRQLRIFGRVERGWISYRKSEAYLERKKTEDKMKREMKEALQLLKEQKKEIYADFREGLLTLGDYEYMKRNLEEKAEQYRVKIQNLDEQNRIEDEVQNTMRQHRQDILDGLTGKEVRDDLNEGGRGNILANKIYMDMLDKLIEKIVIYSSGRVEITYAYADEFEKWSMTIIGQ